MHKLSFKTFNLIGCCVLLSGVGVSASLGVTYANPTETVLNNRSDNKLFYDNRYFNNMDEVTDYYLFKNDVVSSDFYFGDVSEAIYDYTNGLLDANQLYPIDYKKTTNAYTNAYGGYEQTKQAALDTFINETRMVTKYSDYNGGLFYEYDQALDSLRSKTKDYKMIHNQIKINDNTININPMNVDDQNELKRIALSEVLANKPNSPFQLSYYYDNPAISATNYVGLNQLNILSDLDGFTDALRILIGDVFKKNLYFTGTVRAKEYGHADYNLGVSGVDAYRVGRTWNTNSSDSTREFYIRDMTPIEVEALAIFENQKATKSSPSWWNYYRVECCDREYITDNRKLALTDKLTFTFDLSNRTRNWYHGDHGAFGTPGANCGVIDYSKGNRMLFNAAAVPSYFLNKETNERFDLTRWDITPQRIKEMHNFILEIAFSNLKENHKLYNENELTFLMEMMKQSISTGLGTQKVFGEKLKGMSMYENPVMKFSDFLGNLNKDLKASAEWNNSLNIYRKKMISNVSIRTMPIIIYNKRPLYNIDLYKFLSDSESQIIQNSLEQLVMSTFNNLNFLQILKSAYAQLPDGIKDSQLLFNVSQNVELDTDYLSNVQPGLYKQNQVSDLWINDSDSFNPVSLPNTTVQDIGNLITSLSPDKTDDYYLNNILYYYSQNKNSVDNENLSKIPVLYGLNGSPEAYISAYFGSSRDTNQSLSQSSVSLYANEHSVLNAKQNLTSLMPSKVNLVIGPNGKPLPIGSAPGSDGFYNAFENVLINAGFEFSLKPSEKFIFYDKKLISNNYNLIYQLDMQEHLLYFADFTKLRYYIQEFLKLEVTVVQ